MPFSDCHDDWYMYTMGGSNKDLKISG